MCPARRSALVVFVHKTIRYHATFRRWLESSAISAGRFAMPRLVKRKLARGPMQHPNLGHWGLTGNGGQADRFPYGPPSRGHRRHNHRHFHSRLSAGPTTRNEKLTRVRGSAKRWPQSSATNRYEGQSSIPGMSKNRRQTLELKAIASRMTNFRVLRPSDEGNVGKPQLILDAQNCLYLTSSIDAKTGQLANPL